MDIIRLCAWGYAALLGFVILTGYIPAFIDANDMIFGLFTGSGYLDFGILINGIRDLPLTTRVFTNAPHLGLGGVAILIGYLLAPRTRAAVHA